MKKSEGKTTTKEESVENAQPNNQLSMQDAVAHIESVLEKANRSGALSLAEASATMQVWGALKQKLAE